ncbi:MAG: hypothetical protein RSF02_00640, partial [Bacilli bacterium]
LSLLSVGIISASATKVNATTNDITINSETNEVIDEETDLFCFMALFMAGALTTSMLGLLISENKKFNLLDSFCEDKLKIASSLNINDTFDLNFSVLAKEVLNSFDDYDIDLIIFCIFYNLQNSVDLYLSVFDENINDFDTNEYMNKLFMEMKKILKNHESEYPLEIVESCNFGSFTEYLEFRNFSSLNEYKDYMLVVFRNKDNEKGTQLLKKMNNKELDYKYFGDFILNCNELENIDFYIRYIYFELIKYVSCKYKSFKKMSPTYDKSMKINKDYVFDFMDSLFSYMQEKTKNHDCEYSTLLINSCNFRSFNEYIHIKGFNSIKEYEEKMDILNNQKVLELDVKRILRK